jgi:hypothetical protein
LAVFVEYEHVTFFMHFRMKFATDVLSSTAVLCK